MKVAIALLLVLVAVAEARHLQGGHVHDGCKIVKDYQCDPKGAVSCGHEACAYPYVCATIEKEVLDPALYLDPTYLDPTLIACADPKYLCHEVLKPCGDPSDKLFCKYNEQCVTEKVCAKNSFFHEECKDVAACVAFDPKVCQIVDHYACVKEDPAIDFAGYYYGYPMSWYGDYILGEKCGDTVCDPGYSCATCKVEVCGDVVKEAVGEKCGAAGYCDPGSMCVGLCDPAMIKATITVKSDVCLKDPKTDVYWKYYYDYYGYGEECGYEKCDPGYKCKVVEKEVCDPAYYKYAVEDPPKKYYDYAVEDPPKKYYDYAVEDPPKKYYDPDNYYDDYKPTKKPVDKPRSGAYASSKSVATDDYVYTQTDAKASGNGNALAGAGAGNDDSLALSLSGAADNKAETSTNVKGNGIALADALFD